MPPLRMGEVLPLPYVTAARFGLTSGFRAELTCAHFRQRNLRTHLRDAVMNTRKNLREITFLIMLLGIHVK